jgi:predicted 3-demethylubiquinone-9 3-methyltransferase (glyoxalase superfamily)
MQKIKPCLWFDDRIEEAVKFYTGLFKNSRILETSHYPDGRVLVIVFEIDGEEIMALNGGPEFKFTEAVSLFVDCEDQAEVDRYWNALTADGGAESQCGWLRDKYGLSWQIVPNAMSRYLGGSDKAGAARAMQAMMKMSKIVLADLEKAYAG